MVGGDGRKIFITGGTGFIGRHLVERLSKEHTLIVLAKTYRGAEVLESLPNVRVIIGDITKPETYKNYLKGIDVVYHLAFLATDWAPKKDYYHVNIEGSLKLYKLSKEIEVKRFIYISSASVYNPRLGIYGPLNKSYNKSKLPYIATSVGVERFLWGEVKSSGMDIVIIRPVWVYGPGDKKFFPEIFKHIKSGTFPLVGFRDKRIPLIYIYNLILILEKAMLEPQAKEKVLLAADQEMVTWRELINIITEKLSVRIKFSRIPTSIAYLGGYFCEILTKFLHSNSRPPITRFSVREMSKNVQIDMSETERILHYKQEKSFFEGISETINYYKKSKLV